MARVETLLDLKALRLPTYPARVRQTGAAMRPESLDSGASCTTLRAGTARP